MPSLLVKAGEQGLLGASVPEDLGGLGKDFITSTLVNEGLGGGFSFSVAVAAHTGIGTLAYFIFWNGRTKEKIYSQTGNGRMERSLRTNGTE
jgi:alkylation response protein AidB-like acyl-CoA dehydrogenase